MGFPNIGWLFLGKWVLRGGGESFFVSFGLRFKGVGCYRGGFSACISGMLLAELLI